MPGLKWVGRIGIVLSLLPPVACAKSKEPSIDPSPDPSGVGEEITRYCFLSGAEGPDALRERWGIDVGEAPPDELAVAIGTPPGISPQVWKRHCHSGLSAGLRNYHNRYPATSEVTRSPVTAMLAAATAAAELCMLLAQSGDDLVSVSRYFGLQTPSPRGVADALAATMDRRLRTGARGACLAALYWGVSS